MTHSPEEKSESAGDPQHREGDAPRPAEIDLTRGDDEAFTKRLEILNPRMASLEDMQAFVDAIKAQAEEAKRTGKSTGRSRRPSGGTGLRRRSSRL